MFNCPCLCECGRYWSVFRVRQAYIPLATSSVKSNMCDCVRLPPTPAAALVLCVKCAICGVWIIASYTDTGSRPFECSHDWSVWWLSSLPPLDWNQQLPSFMTDYHSSNVSDLYSRDDRFESRLEHRLARLILWFLWFSGRYRCAALKHVTGSSFLILSISPYILVLHLIPYKRICTWYSVHI